MGWSHNKATVFSLPEVGNGAMLDLLTRPPTDTEELIVELMGNSAKEDTAYFESEKRLIIILLW